MRVLNAFRTQHALLLHDSIECTSTAASYLGLVALTFIAARSFDIRRTSLNRPCVALSRCQKFAALGNFPLLTDSEYSDRGPCRSTTSRASAKGSCSCARTNGDTPFARTGRHSKCSIHKTASK
eukprot:1265174-Pleurochrysis_carterae.AAC.1